MTNSRPIPSDYAPPAPPQWETDPTFDTGDCSTCHFCSEPMSESDQSAFMANRARHADGHEIERPWEWMANGQVIPVCAECRESICQEPDFPEFDAVDRWGMIFWRWIVGLVVAASGAIVASALSR
ncbi:MAG: hypothetical protein AB8G99_14280 [Planctomycetaceae bacterium]